MPPFRFHIPFFSNNSPSRVSSATSSPSPPPTPLPSRPHFRPAGIAQPSKLETKSPSLSRVRSNVAALAPSLPASQLPSRGAATPDRLSKQTNQQSSSSSKKLDSLRTNEQKATTKDKQPGETDKVAGENINLVTEKPPIARSEEHLELKEAEAVQEQKKKTGVEKLPVQERKKVLHEGIGEKPEADQGKHNKKETKKLALQEMKRAFQEDATPSKTRRLMLTASESTRELPQRETKTQSRTEIHTDDKSKGVSTSNHENTGVINGQGSYSTSRRIKEDIRDGLSNLTWGKSNSDDKSVSVYTLSGENRGATMGIGSEKGNKDGEVHIRRGYKSNPDESPNTTATGMEGGGRPLKDKNPINVDDEEEANVRVYVNGNTQGINNSVIVESSVSENDPGIHMSVKLEQVTKEIINPPNNVPEKKFEIVTATEKVKNEPRVRRRCLRGLLAESSESENPLKPRKHGCRFTCKDKDIENT